MLPRKNHALIVRKYSRDNFNNEKLGSDNLDLGMGQVHVQGKHFGQQGSD